jgi:hypothetical protein
MDIDLFFKVYRKLRVHSMDIHTLNAGCAGEAAWKKKRLLVTERSLKRSDKGERWLIYP